MNIPSNDWSAASNALIQTIKQCCLSDERNSVERHICRMALDRAEPIKFLFDITKFGSNNMSLQALYCELDALEFFINHYPAISDYQERIADYWDELIICNGIANHFVRQAIELAARDLLDELLPSWREGEG